MQCFGRFEVDRAKKPAPTPDEYYGKPTFKPSIGPPVDRAAIEAEQERFEVQKAMTKDRLDKERAMKERKQTAKAGGDFNAARQVLSLEERIEVPVPSWVNESELEPKLLGVDREHLKFVEKKCEVRVELRKAWGEQLGLHFFVRAKNKQEMTKDNAS